MSTQTDFIVEQVRLKERVFRFLESKDLLKSVEQKLIQKLKANVRSQNPSQNHRFEPLVVNLNLSFGEVDEASILYLVTKETKHFITLSEEIVHCFVTNILKESGSKDTIRLEQIHCSIRFYDLPLIPAYKFRLCSVHINCCLTSFHCIIYSKGPIEKYVRQSVWECLKCFGLPKIIHKNRDSDRNPHCDRCQNDCSEIISQRSTSSFCSARVFELDTYKRSYYCNSSLTFSVELKLYDDLCQDLKLGQEYIVIGTFEPFYNYYNVSTILLANKD